MNWRDRCGKKLISLEQAIGKVKGGDLVTVAPYTCTHHTLCGALIARLERGDLAGIRVEHPASFTSWTHPEVAGKLELRDIYATPPNRAACHQGEMEYVPIGIWRSYETPAGLSQNPDVFLVPVSPPDERGFCSFGPGVWMSGTLCRGAGMVIAEVQENFIRTHGENYVHVSEIDWFVEATIPTGSAPTPPPPAEDVLATEVICTMVASELVNNRDTIQLGVGTVSASMGLFLGEKEDLGVQTELITGGIVDLVRNGVVTGKYKSMHRYKVVGSALVALPEEEFRAIHENPVFELYDFGYTDDLRRLIQQDNFVAINNALVVDLTGQVSAEAWNHQMYTGVGGQTVFMIAGAYSPGGKSISVLPSSSVPSASGERVSRIQATLAPGCPVTVPRTYVDYVVTEQGIATLRGKSIKERALELVSVSHPEFRKDLARAANELYNAGIEV